MATALRTEELIRRITPISVSEGEHEGLEMLFRQIANHAATRKRPDQACLIIGKDGEPTPIPESVFFLFERIIEILSRGDAVTVVPIGKELTTQQAADMLNISRQFLVRLLDEGKLPYSKTGKHRRLKIEDVLSYKEKRGQERQEGLRRLSRLTQEFGGYDPEDK
jgi:excisionase family DNA binding protein